MEHCSAILKITLYVSRNAQPVQSLLSDSIFYVLLTVLILLGPIPIIPTAFVPLLAQVLLQTATGIILPEHAY